MTEYNREQMLSVPFQLVQVCSLIIVGVNLFTTTVSYVSNIAVLLFYGHGARHQMHNEQLSCVFSSVNAVVSCRLGGKGYIAMIEGYRLAVTRSSLMP